MIKRNSSPKSINSANVVVPEQGVRWWSSCSPQLSGWGPELWGRAPLAGCRWSDDGTGRWDCLLFWCEPTQQPRISSLLSGLWLQAPIVHLYTEIHLYNMSKKWNSLQQSPQTNSTFEDPLSDCVVLALLDVFVKLPGQNHYILLHLKEPQETHASRLYTLRQDTMLIDNMLKRWSSYLALGVKAEWKAHGVSGDAVSDHRGRRQSCSRDRAG